MMTRLITDRLMMRRATLADYDAYHALASDFDVVKWTATWPWPAVPSRTLERCKPFDPKWGMAGPVFNKGQMVGGMGIVSQDVDGPKLGYMLAREAWGKGFATEMACELIKHCWARYEWDQIGAAVFQGNVASRSVLQKLGFSKCGTATAFCQAQGKDLPVQKFALPRPPAK
ncbi:GNAT family N-acetyltransferase [Planktotalea lamellibrachiae]|nr:GNAT family N-acetyltransferase [Aliiroseovarius lamellibrachiae]